MKAKVMPAHRDERHSIDNVVGRAKALSRKLMGDKTGASVEDFLADRAREAEAE